MVATERFIGRSVLRKEDPKLLTGQAEFIDNLTMPGMVWIPGAAAVTSTPRSTRSTRSAAAAMPGVVGVYHGGRPGEPRRGLPIRVADHRGHQGAGALPAGQRQDPVRRRRRRGGLAETREQAEDAAEVITVSATELSAVPICARRREG